MREIDVLLLAVGIALLLSSAFIPTVLLR